jgi:hypothetical protein
MAVRAAWTVAGAARRSARTALGSGTIGFALPQTTVVADNWRLVRLVNQMVTHVRQLVPHEQVACRGRKATARGRARVPARWSGSPRCSWEGAGLGAAEVLATLPHEAAHDLACMRRINDTSRRDAGTTPASGRWRKKSAPRSPRSENPTRGSVGGRPPPSSIRRSALDRP